MNIQYRLKAIKMDFKLPVRNIKDGNKSAYENYMPDTLLEKITLLGDKNNQIYNLVTDDSKDINLLIYIRQKQQLSTTEF